MRKIEHTLNEVLASIDRMHRGSGDNMKNDTGAVQTFGQDRNTQSTPNHNKEEVLQSCRNIFQYGSGRSISLLKKIEWVVEEFTYMGHSDGILLAILITHNDPRLDSSDLAEAQNAGHLLAHGLKRATFNIRHIDIPYRPGSHRPYFHAFATAARCTTKTLRSFNELGPTLRDIEGHVTAGRVEKGWFGREVILPLDYVYMIEVSEAMKETL
jgi:hypothetical protein